MMKDHKQIYTSSLDKIYANLDRLYEFQQTGVLRPITLNFSPTNQCNLNCSFCSVKNRNRFEKLELDQAIDLLDLFAARGIKTLKFTGGGEPTLWEYFNEFIDYCKKTYPYIKFGLITNGTNFDNLYDEVLFSFEWIRISLNYIDQNFMYEFPAFNPYTIISYSYVYNKDTNDQKVIELFTELLENDPHPILKIQMDVFDENLKLSDGMISFIDYYKDRVFINKKKEEFVAENCYMGWVKPVIEPNGKIYRCSCNALAEQKYNKKYEIEDYTLIPDTFDTSQCSYCFFGPQNKLIQKIDECRNLKHGRFI